MELQVLGPPQVKLGHGWADVPLTKPMLLLFYLAFHGTWVSREELAFFFRPDADEATARHYVRKMLSDARRLSWTCDLEVENDRLRWRIATDVRRFTESARAGRWAEALSLYRGPLLGSLQVDGSPSFGAWLDLKREELGALWQRACMGHASELESAGEHAEAAAVVKTLLQHDSLAEDALQSYLRNTYLAGKRESALRAAEAFRQELFQELGLEPLEETKRLVGAIERSQPVARSSPGRKYGRRSTDRPSLPASEQDLADLLRLLQDPNARLLDVSTHAAGKGALIIARRVPDTQTALQAITDLAAWLASQGHYQRAAELLPLALNHPLCDDEARRKAQRLRSFLAARASEHATDDAPTPRSPQKDSSPQPL